MNILSPIHYIKKRRARRKQLRTVLQMLSVSGVVRAGHIEPRYFEPSSQVDALYTQKSKGPQTAASPAIRSHVQLSTFGFDWPRLRQLATAKPSRLQIEQ